MGLLPIIAAVGSIVGGLSSGKAAKKAAEAQAQSAREQLALQTRMYDEGKARVQPYENAGQTALGAYQGELGLAAMPAGYQRFGGFKTDPGYQFRLKQGQDALQSSAAARGNVLSGATMQAFGDYNQGMASQEYGNWYGRKQDHLNRLAGLTSSGQNAALGQVAAGANYANAASGTIGSAGNAQAAGIIGQGNALSGALNNAVTSYGYLSNLQGGGGWSMPPQGQNGGYTYSPWG